MRVLVIHLVIAVSLLAGLVGSASGSAPSAAEPRTLVLALDGVPLRSIQAAVQQGAFQEWSRPVAMVSPFPSMTSVAFTAILRPFCVHPIAGYETLYFNRQDNKMESGISKKYLETYFPWRTHFLVRKRSYKSNIAGYTRPMHSARKMVKQIEGILLGSTTDPIMAHVGPTDVVTHVRGDAPVIKYLQELSVQLKQLEIDHEKKWGRPLRIVMLSDHGNTKDGVSSARDLRGTLRQAGFRTSSKLEGSRDIVIPAYGAVSYSALYLDPARAEDAGLAAIGNEAVELAAWLRQPGEMRVVSKAGEAVVRWREVADSLRFSYDSLTGDPLRLAEVRSELVTSSRQDASGFADASDWFSATVGVEFPDPLRRLVDSLTGMWVENPANVMLSLFPNRAWGSRKAFTGAFLMGGGLEGTHGALETESTMGFLIANEPLPEDWQALQARRALIRWFDQGDCVTMTRVE